MLESQFNAIFWFSGACLFAALALNRYHEDPEVFAAISLGGYGLLSLRADTLTVVTQDGSRVMAGSGEMQYYTLALALLALLAVVGSVTGKWPATTDTRGEIA